MFLAHYAAGLAAKKWAPKLSLGTLLLASIWLDLLWSLFLLLGWESVRIVPGITKVMPVEFTDYALSHSLTMALAWALLFGLVTLIITQDELISLVLAGLVASNWFLNVIVHHSDMYLLPAADFMGWKWGLGLWNSPIGTFVVEAVFFAAGLWVYLKSTKALDKAGRWGFAAFYLLLAAVFIGGFFAPVPKNAGWVTIVGQVELLFVAFGYWVDDHRKPV